MIVECIHIRKKCLVELDDLILRPVDLLFTRSFGDNRPKPSFSDDKLGVLQKWLFECLKYIVFERRDPFLFLTQVVFIPPCDILLERCDIDVRGDTVMSQCVGDKSCRS